ncbi:MAG: hypothetical protein U9Q85_01405, partial [Patescibacteria group bacterium]|nr:hypothetical protein [Patescibacteria group bacterium]
FIDNNQNVGIATNTPQYQLTVAGDMMLTGAIYDNNYSAGTDGYIMQTTGSGVEWIATSSLGLGLGGTVNSGTIGQIPYYAAAGDTLTATSTLFIDTNSYVGIGSSTPNSLLSIGDN